MRMVGGRIVLFVLVVLESSTEAYTPIAFLQCIPTAHEVVSGQNLRINCVLDSGFGPGDPCFFKADGRPDCCCGGQPCECQLKTVHNIWKRGHIPKATVEVYNVTITGTYRLSMETTCDTDVDTIVEIKVTRLNNEELEKLMTATPQNTELTNTNTTSV